MLVTFASHQRKDVSAKQNHTKWLGPYDIARVATVRLPEYYNVPITHVLELFCIGEIVAAEHMRAVHRFPAEQSAVLASPVQNNTYTTHVAR